MQKLTNLFQLKSYTSASCLINMEPFELLRLQPSEVIASESAVSCLLQLSDCSHSGVELCNDYPACNVLGDEL